MNYTAEHSIGPPQQALGAVKVALAQSLAYRGTAHAHTFEHERRDLLHAEAARLARRPQTVDGAAGVAAISKIISDHDVPRTQACDDQFIDKAFGRHLPYVLIESQRHQAIDTLCGQGKELLPPARETWRCALRIDEFLGTRLKDQDRRRRAQFPGACF